MVSGHETQPYSGSSIDELCCCCCMAVFHGHSLCPLMIPMLFSYFLIGIPNRMAPLPVDLLGAQGGFVATSDVVNGLLGVLLLLL